MKNLLILLLISISFSLNAQEYCVMKIDSTKMAYLITITNKNLNFEGIVISSKKIHQENEILNTKVKIEEGKKYFFDIDEHAMLSAFDIPRLKVETPNSKIFIEDVDICSLNIDSKIYEASNLFRKCE
jgi:hypothetical protein